MLEMTEEGVRVVEDCTKAEIHQQVRLFVQMIYLFRYTYLLPRLVNAVYQFPGPDKLSAAVSKPGTAGSQSKKSVKSFHLRFCPRGGKWKIK